MRFGWLAVVILMAVPAFADPEDQARAALAELEAASQQLADAQKARNRVKALTATVQAFENGLAAMREGLRQAAVRERALATKLAGQETEIAALLGALQIMGRTDSPTALLHPSGAVGTARAGMLLAEIGPALNRKAEELRSDLDEVRTLRLLQQTAADQMVAGLNEIQDARSNLNQALAERRDLPKRFTSDPARTAILIASAETLAGFASGLSQIVVNDTDPTPELAASKPIGSWDLPVQGVLLRKAGEADAAGVVRPGLLLATRSEALVTTPSAATLRYVGPLLDFGQVVILEPQVGSLLVLAGLGRTFGEAGQVITEGTPVGMMGGRATTGDDLLSTGSEGAGTDRSETLYIEVRQENRPVDPEKWFTLSPEG